MRVKVFLYDFEIEIADSEVEGLDEDRLSEFIEDKITDYITKNNFHYSYTWSDK